MNIINNNALDQQYQSLLQIINNILFWDLYKKTAKQYHQGYW